MGTKPKNAAHILTFGNEKGGSGKSTSAMHVAVALLRMGYKVGTIDLDARQGTLTRYMKNRWDYVVKTRKDTPSPAHMAIERSEAATLHEQRADERMFLTLALAELSGACDFIVIDTPGTDNYLSRLAHYFADTIVTPLNDSFIDLDLIARVDGDTDGIAGPSIYTDMVMETRATREKMGIAPAEWVVMRNRVSHISAKNKERIGDILDHAATQFDFRVAPGFTERVVFKELFLKGLTLLDIREEGDHELTLSEIAARQEVRALINTIGPIRLKGYAESL